MVAYPGKIITTYGYVVAELYGCRSKGGEEEGKSVPIGTAAQGPPYSGVPAVLDLLKILA